MPLTQEHWGLIDHDSATDEVVAIEVWSASKRLPPKVLARSWLRQENTAPPQKA
jgi:uncharacterized protein YuzE